MPDQLLNAFLSSKLVFWEENNGLPETEIQQRWKDRVAFLTTELGANPIEIGPPTSTVPQKRVVPSTNSLGGPRPSKRRDTTSKAPSPQLLQRQVSAPASTLMRRRRSSKTNSGSGPGTSRTKQTSTRPINIPPTRSSDTWPAPIEAFQNYTSHSLPVHDHSRTAHRPYLGDCQVLSLSEYLSHSPDQYHPPGLSLTPSPTVARDDFPPQDRSRLSVSSTTPGYAWNSFSSSTCVSDAGMTSASTATSEPMSRSTTNEILSEPLAMCRVSSQVSRCDFSETPTLTDDHSSFDLDSLFFPESFDSSLLKSLPDVSFSSLSQSQSLPESFLPTSVDMLHSPSQESNASSTSSDSSQSRHVRRVREQNTQSKRPLAPKTQSQKTELATPAAKIVEVVAEDGTLQKKAQISRASRQPKETSKVFCPVCNEHKEGFHGDHELRRHIDRTHKGLRKVFVCKDISPNGTFLANCARCRNMKSYGANYNAAAHLRRIHFNPCETPKGGRGKVSQNRGGIGGGDQPPMDVLRNWMHETWETNMNVLLDESHMMTTTYTPSTQSSSSDAGIPQPNDTVQISETDLDFVQRTTQLDMSFLRFPTTDAFSMPPPSSPQRTTQLDMSSLRFPTTDAFSMPPQSSPTDQIFFTPSQQEIPFFDADFTT